MGSQVFDKLNGNANVAKLVVEGIRVGSSDHSRAKAPQSVLLFLRHLLRHGDNHAIPQRGRSHRQTHPCVSTGWFNKNVALFQLAGLSCVKDHTSANAIFDRAARVEELALGEQFTLNVLLFCDVVDSDEGCVAHVVKNVVTNFLVVISLFNAVRTLVALSFAALRRPFAFVLEATFLHAVGVARIIFLT